MNTVPVFEGVCPELETSVDRIGDRLQTVHLKGEGPRYSTKQDGGDCGHITGTHEGGWVGHTQQRVEGRGAIGSSIISLVAVILMPVGEEMRENPIAGRHR
jgi:hypothetical protein